MKRTILTAATAVAMILFGGVYGVSAQDVVPQEPLMVGGVGPVIAGSVSSSQLPLKARKFIDKSGSRVMKIERKYTSGEYDVRLDSGIEIEFNSDGRIVEIEAPDHGFLSADLVRDMVPGKLYSNLKELGLDMKVTSIESKRDGYKVEFDGSQYEEAFFTPGGDLIALYYD